jgi:hypothetical protein
VQYKSAVRQFATVLIMICIVACAGTDQVGVDLVQYVNQDIMGIAQVESKALARYAAVTGGNYRDDQTLLTALQQDVIPLYKRFLILLRQVQPQRKEVRRLHAIYLNGAEDLYDGFRIMRSGLQNQDQALIRTANRKIVQGRTATEKWRNELRFMSETHGVALTGSNASE